MGDIHNTQMDSVSETRNLGVGGGGGAQGGGGGRLLFDILHRPRE